MKGMAPLKSFGQCSAASLLQFAVEQVSLSVLIFRQKYHDSAFFFFSSGV
jgi:hypothetical protein